jgi:outer membrane protein
MKKFATNLAGALLLLWFAAPCVQAQGRIGTVDLTKVFDNYWKTKQAQASLNEHKADLTKEDNNMIQEYNTAKTNYAKLLEDSANPALSADERDRRKKAAEEKLKQLRESEDQIKQFETQARVTIEEQGQRLRNNILTEIRNALSAKAKSAGYTMIFDTSAESAQHTPIIPYVTEDNDLTKDLIEQLNLGQPKDVARPEDKSEKKEEKKTTPK